MSSDSLYNNYRFAALRNRGQLSDCKMIALLREPARRNKVGVVTTEHAAGHDWASGTP